MTALWRPFLCSTLALLGLGIPLSLQGGQDWVDLRSVRVAEPGKGQVSLGVDHSVQETWALGDRYALMVDTDNTIRIQREVAIELDLAWQWNAAWGIKLGLPYRLAEFSPYPYPGQVFRLDDPTVHRTDSLGDITLELRRAWGSEPGVPGRFAGFWFGVTGPSGIGPFEAPNPLAATGEGRWQLRPGFIVGGQRGAWSLSAQVLAPLQLGREETLSSQAPLGFGADGAQYPAGGNVWLGPRYGIEAGMGLAWDWLAVEEDRQSLALELRAWHRSPLDQAGTLTPDTEQAEVTLIPQIQAHFGRFHALAGWSLPYPFIYAYNIPAADYGASHLRVDYGF